MLEDAGQRTRSKGLCPLQAFAGGPAPGSGRSWHLEWFPYREQVLGPSWILETA